MNQWLTRIRSQNFVRRVADELPVFPPHDLKGYAAVEFRLTRVILSMFSEEGESPCRLRPYWRFDKAYFQKEVRMQLSRATAAKAARPYGEVSVSRVRKPYHAPTFSQLNPDHARKTLLLQADGSDPAVQQMLDRIEVSRENR